MGRATGGSRRVRRLALLLVVLAGAGAWNYQRNLAEEARVPRPFRGYADADLEAMAVAYGRELEQYEKRWEEASARRSSSSGHGHLDDRAREFDRVYEHGRAVRALKEAATDRRVAWDQIQEEQRLRARERDLVRLHLSRLTSLD